MGQARHTIHTILAALIIFTPISAFSENVTIRYRVAGEKWSKAILVTNSSSLQLKSFKSSKESSRKSPALPTQQPNSSAATPIVEFSHPRVTGVDISGKHPTPYLALVATALSGVLLFVHNDKSKLKASGIAGVVSSLIALLHKKSEIHTITDKDGVQKIQIKLTKKNREALEWLYLQSLGVQ